tara:strand:- start:1127 stop:1339 length:213 start_codon:yes stop_codon:yes gene_type:complete
MKIQHIDVGNQTYSIGQKVSLKARALAGVIVQIPHPDDYWGSTFVITWANNETSEHTVDEFEIILEDFCG